MINVSENAREKLHEILDGRNDASIRVYIAGMDCGGPNWTLGVDQPSDLDEVLDLDGIQVVADKELLEKFGDLSIEYAQSGLSGAFRVTHTKKLGKTCYGGRCSC